MDLRFYVLSKEEKPNVFNFYTTCATKVGFLQNV